MEQTCLLAVRGGGALREVGEGTSVFGGVDAPKGELAVSIISVTARLRSKVDAKGLGRLSRGECTIGSLQIQ